MLYFPGKKHPSTTFRLLELNYNNSNLYLYSTLLFAVTIVLLVPLV